MIARIIDEDHEVVAALVERLLDPGEQTVMRGNLGDRFDEADHRKGFHPVQHAHTGALHQGTAKGLELDSGETPAQRRRDRGRMRVPRWLARRYVDPRGLAGAHGLADATGDVSIASATR